ncbi:MAG TPA: hypothetical protein VMG10_09995 [Gemmataceae bacterium]|nr:hypothetical protein [Gemmataceae bacterium]
MGYRSLTVIVLLSASGCGGSTDLQADISGTVSYGGQPLPGGMITFVPGRGLAQSAVIGPDGHYQIKAAVGHTKVTIDNRMLRKEQVVAGPRLKPPTAAAVSSPSVSGTYVPLPEKYLSAEQSGLTCEVQKGSQVHDFKLDAS